MIEEIRACAEMLNSGTTLNPVGVFRPVDGSEEILCYRPDLVVGRFGTSNFKGMYGGVGLPGVSFVKGVYRTLPWEPIEEVGSGAEHFLPLRQVSVKDVTTNEELDPDTLIPLKNYVSFKGVKIL